MDNQIINRVDASGLMVLDLEDYYQKGERIVYDIKINLYQDLILKEKDFREFLKSHNWDFYTDKFVAITCSVDVIIPTWAYMLLISKITPFARHVVIGDKVFLEKILILNSLHLIDKNVFKDQRVVVKGCGKLKIDSFAYGEITKVLLPVVKSLMFGEPCSTVPIYKFKN